MFMIGNAMNNSSMDLPSSDRYISVFVSSTFLDMDAERDYLVKFTFPQLRKVCESRAVTWGERELRWGIPEKEEDEGKLLLSILKVVRDCSFFIGLLGERYGTIADDHILPELEEEMPWLKDYRHNSITELEILHGVFNNPGMAAGQAYFYFRDPTYLDRLPVGSKLSNFRSESGQEKQHLTELKRKNN